MLAFGGFGLIVSQLVLAAGLGVNRSGVARGGAGRLP
jgi:hypothetical protein